MNKSNDNLTPDFSRVLRGYAPSEVEEYIQNAAKEKAELNSYIRELEKRISLLMRQNENLLKTNATPKYIMDEARSMADKIIDNANDEAGIIIASAKTSCDNLLNEFRFRMGQERDKLNVLQNTIGEFKSALYAAYQKHIDNIESITDKTDMDKLEMDYEVYREKVVSDIKTEVAYLTAELKQRHEREAERKIDDAYFANREAELEAELAEINAQNEAKSEAFNPDVDLSDFSGSNEANQDDSAELEFVEDATGGNNIEEASIPVFDDASPFTVNDSIPLYEDETANKPPKSDAMQSYDDILENFAKELDEEQSENNY